MKEQTIFPREEHADVLFQKILADPWACDKLFETFCNDLFSNDELEDSLSADEFCQALTPSWARPFSLSTANIP